MQSIQEHIESMDDHKRGKEFVEPIVNVFKKQGFTVMAHLDGAKLEDLTEFTTLIAGQKALVRKSFWQLDRQELAAAPTTPVVGGKPVSAEDLAAFLASANNAVTKAPVKKLVDIGMFLSSDPTLHDLSPELWPSPHLANLSVRNAPDFRAATFAASIDRDVLERAELAVQQDSAKLQHEKGGDRSQGYNDRFYHQIGETRAGLTRLIWAPLFFFSLAGG